MKRNIIISLVLVSVLIYTTSATATNSPSIFINGKQLVSQNPAINENGRTLVPLTEIFKAFNQKVNWNQNDQSISSVNIWLQINNPVVIVNSNKITLDVSAKIIDSKTYVPLRFVAESLGKSVKWNGDENRIDITDTPDNVSTDNNTINDQTESVSKQTPDIENNKTKTISTKEDAINLLLSRFSESELKNLYNKGKNGTPQEREEVKATLKGRLSEEEYQATKSILLGK